MSKRKLLLAQVRKGNYAHAGEEEAIDLTFSLIKKDPTHELLDLGCGLGGTAHYLEQQGFGKVVGIDIDVEVLEQAKVFYPEIPFYLCNATSVATFFKTQLFDLFYSFNAFFCFNDQENCLKQCAKIAKENAELVIFDYSSPAQFSGESPFIDEKCESRSALFFAPINLSTIEQTLSESGWELLNIINFNERYILWYKALISKMENNKDVLIERFGKIPFNDLLLSYQRLMDMMKNGLIGGSGIHAKRRIQQRKLSDF